jgi:hypothetical protein
VGGARAGALAGTANDGQFVGSNGCRTPTSGSATGAAANRVVSVRKFTRHRTIWTTDSSDRAAAIQINICPVKTPWKTTINSDSPVNLKADFTAGKCVFNLHSQPAIRCNRRCRATVNYHDFIASVSLISIISLVGGEDKEE